MITLQEAAEFFLASAARCPEVMSGVVAGVVEAGAERAKGLIGNEHDGWAPLSGATVYGFRHPRAGWIPGKEELGYGGFESPLLRTGQMRDSIEFSVASLIGEVGSNDKRALWQELGTVAEYSIPPRPFISRGLLEAAEAVFPELMGPAVLSLLVP